MGHGHMMTKPEMSTEGVRMLLGDPKKAIVKLSIPIFISLIATGALHITDMVWVSGLGPKPLSALGFFVPLYMLASAIAAGIGVGGGTRISQRIGAMDKKGADQFTMHMFFILFVAGALLVGALYFLAEPLFLYMGANESIDLAISYARIMTFAFIFLLFSEGAYAIFRSEGNARLVMVISLIGVILNMVLDPIFIYPLGLGVAGAAWASFTALLIATLLSCYWLIIRKTTYVSVIFKGFRLKKETIQQILHLGIPISIGQILMASMLFVNIKIIAYVGGVNGVAVFSSGLRYMHFLTLPLIGVSSAAVTVIGAAHGAVDREKMRIAFSYSLKIGMVVAGVMLVFTVLAAPLITKMFTWSEGASVLTGDLTTFFRIVFWGHPALAISMITGALFSGVGRSVKTLMLEVFRNILFTIPLVFVFGVLMGAGLTGVWTGIVLANWAAAILAAIWAKRLFDGLNASPDADALAAASPGTREKADVVC